MPPMKIVLIIDDEPEYRRMLGEVLQDHGWQVLSAEAGDEGIRLAKSHMPTVVLCDLLMPRCNGVSGLPIAAPGQHPA